MSYNPVGLDSLLFKNLNPIHFFISFILLSIQFTALPQDYYDRAHASFNKNQLDSARYFVNKALENKPTPKNFFLSGIIHEAENKPLIALADYEAVIQKNPTHLEAYFQKGLIYYHFASTDQAIDDFTYVIENQSNSETKAIYYVSNPLNSKGTFLTTLTSMIAEVYQFRGLAYQKIGQNILALEDFNKVFEFDTLPDYYVNRALLHSKMDKNEAAIVDLKKAISLEESHYLAWYNLAILDKSVILPEHLLNDERMTPMLNLMGANAYEVGDFLRSAQYYSKVLITTPNDDFALIGRGKALLKTGFYLQARKDFLNAMQINPARKEAFYLVGNSLFYEKKYEEAISFYDQYLSIDTQYANVWYNAAMSHFTLKNDVKACHYLRRAANLGMDQAVSMLERECNSQ